VYITGKVLEVLLMHNLKNEYYQSDYKVIVKFETEANSSTLVNTLSTLTHIRLMELQETTRARFIRKSLRKIYDLFSGIGVDKIYIRISELGLE